MKPMMERAHMLTNFVSNKAILLSSVPLLIAMPIRSVMKDEKSLDEQEIEKNQKVETIKRRQNHKNVILSLGALLGCITLPGCTGSTYSSHFDCSMGEGAGCASISRVNKMIDRREIDLNGDDISTGDGTPVTRTSVPQVYVYYGPNHLSRLISADSQEGK